MATMSDDMNGAGQGGPDNRQAVSGWSASSAAGGSRAYAPGLADYSGIDPSLIRVIFAVLTLFGGVGAIAYVLAWALVPEEGEQVSIAEKVINKSGT